MTTPDFDKWLHARYMKLKFDVALLFAEKYDAKWREAFLGSEAWKQRIPRK